MTYFSRWRGKQSSTVRKSYECDFCLRNKVAEEQGRVCFRYKDEEARIVFPVIDEDGKVVSEDQIEELVDLEEFRNRLTKIAERHPQNVFRLMLRYFGGSRGTSNVCPVSILEPVFSDIIHIATRCEAYSCLPMPGSLADQPNWLMEALDEYRKTNNEYDIEALEEKK